MCGIQARLSWTRWPDGGNTGGGRSMSGGSGRWGEDQTCWLPGETNSWDPTLEYVRNKPHNLARYGHLTNILYYWKIIKKKHPWTLYDQMKIENHTHSLIYCSFSPLKQNAHMTNSHPLYPLTPKWNISFVVISNPRHTQRWGERSIPSQNFNGVQCRYICKCQINKIYQSLGYYGQSYTKPNILS